MCADSAIVWIVFGAVFGIPAAVWPYEFARWGEILNAIGRKPAGPVEPADWNVALTRVVGIGLSILAVGALVSCL